MMEQMMMAAIGDHVRRRRHSRWMAGEDDFYRDLGDSTLVRLASWLTSPRLDLGRRPIPVPSRDDCGCGGRTSCERKSPGEPEPFDPKTTDIDQAAR